MPVRKRKPTSPGRRFQTVSDFAEITRDKPEKSLTKPKPRTGGRNSYGRMTSRHRGGGHKQKYRVVDFRRDKDGVPAKVASIEYDPNRNARIALLHYLDGEKRYIIAPQGLEVGDLLQSGQGSEIRPGNALPLRYIPVGTDGAQRRAEARRGRQARPRRRRGDPARRQGGPVRHAAAAVHRDAPGADRLPRHRRLGRQREAGLVKIGKAGRNRWKGKRPHVRGVAMNPVDHPLGGGEGKSSGGRHPVSPWGKPEGRTRKKGKKSDELIIRRRRGRGARR